MQSRGNSKQEKKIDSLAEVVIENCPNMSKLSVKGSFRFGITESLKAIGVSQWQEVANLSIHQKKQFFSLLLDNSMQHMKRIGLSTDSEAKLRAKLLEENERFLKQ